MKSNYKAMVLSCIDPRFQPIVYNYLKKKKLSGEGENMALWVYLEKSVEEKFNSMEVKNAVFTDLFYDQNNIVYNHINKESKSIMLNKETSTYKLNF